jgi:hypothetical protein
MRTDGRYSYIWCNTKPPPWRATRWAVFLAGAAILVFLFVEDVTVELDPTLRYALSLVDNLFAKLR